MSKNNRRSSRQTRLRSFLSWLYKPDARLLLTVGVPLSLLAALIAGQINPFWLNLPVCYVWITGIFFAYLLGLLGQGRFVLPLSAIHKDDDLARTVPRGWPSMREGIYLLFYHAFFLLLPGSIRRRLGYAEQQDLPKGLPNSFKRYRAGIVPSHLAVSLGSRTAFTRSAGPGFVRAGRYEMVRSTFDLRLQRRAMKVSVTSKDGIPIDTTVSALFRVRQPAAIEDDTIPYPYSGETLFRLLYADSLELNDEEVHWSERICPSIAAALVNEMAKYNFDELYRPPGTTLNEQDIIPAVNIQNAITENLRQQLQQKFEYDTEEENPIQLVNVGFGDLTPPPEILKQRIANWRTEWELEQKRQRLQSEAEAIFTRRVAQANAQMQMMESLTDLLADIEDAPNVELPEVITLRLLEALDRIIEEEPDASKKEQKKEQAKNDGQGTESTSSAGGQATGSNA